MREIDRKWKFLEQILIRLCVRGGPGSAVTNVTMCLDWFNSSQLLRLHPTLPSLGTSFGVSLGWALWFGIYFFVVHAGHGLDNSEEGGGASPRAAGGLVLRRVWRPIRAHWISEVARRMINR